MASKTPEIKASKRFFIISCFEYTEILRQAQDDISNTIYYIYFCQAEPVEAFAFTRTSSFSRNKMQHPERQ